MTYRMLAVVAFSLRISAAYAVAPPAASATIKGQLLHFTDKVVELQIGRQAPVEAPVDATGHFKLTVPLTEAGPASLETNNEYTQLWLTPGDALNVSVDIKQFDETIKYTGVGARVNNYLAGEVLGEEVLGERTKAALGRPPAGYAAFCDSVQAAQTARLTKALSTKPTAAETAFLTWKRREMAYEWVAQRLRYAQRKKLPATDAYYQFLSAPETPLDNPGALTSDAYRSYVPGALAYYAELDGAIAAGSPEQVAVLREAGRRLSTPVRKALQGQLVMEGMQFGPLVAADSVQRYALAHLDLSPAFQKQIADSWAARQLTRPGQPAPDLQAVDADGKPFTWASVRGKVVYLDFWASWCGPCIGEMPAALKLHSALHDNADIVFLNVSIDGKAANWQKGIAQHHVEGINVHSGGDWNSPAIKAYGLSSIPRYLIIGPDGIILDGDAPRPSAGAEDALRGALAGKK
jgi:thiol-disulfide isomerase/thioredoxin